MRSLIKEITLSPREFMENFRIIAKFKYNTYILNGEVYISANKKKLKELGYD